MTNSLLSVVHGQQPLSAYSMPGRAHEQMHQILEDTRMAFRGAPAHADFEQALDAGDPSLNVTVKGFVENLWEDPHNQDLVLEFMAVPLCVDAANGVDEALQAYKDYAAQDFFYLANLITYKAQKRLEVLTDPNHEITFADEADYVDTMNRAVGHANKWKRKCTDDLHIDMKDVKANAAVRAYTDYLGKVARTGNWFSLHVVLIACNYGWSKLALSLYRMPDLKKETDFYKHWLAESLDLTVEGQPGLSASAVKIQKTIDLNAARFQSRLQAEETNKLFRAGLILEIGLFNSVYKRA